MTKQILLCTAFLLQQLCIAQEKKVEPLGGDAYQQKYQLKIRKATQPIKLDGIHNEPDWQMADVAKNFAAHWPQDNVPLKRTTDVKVTFDDKFLYVAAVCQDTSYHVIQTLKRDVTLWDSDAFMLFLDPVNQRTNGFVFTVSPANVQFEDLLTGDSTDEPSGSWDNKWFSETKVYKDHWTVEMAIPFKTLRFDPNKLQWGINFMRCDLKNNQYSTWTFIPVNFNGHDFGYTGALVWEQHPPSVRGNASIIPYITGGINQIEGTKSTFNAGLDAKLSITPSMNLDLTINPDFSQIEVDRQVTNLTRFSIFFPERRTFFLENADLFGSFGLPPIRPFFSRTIGLDNSGQAIPIVAGARLSGNLNKTLRLGLMNMQTQAKNGNPAQNFSAVTFQQRVLARSSIRGYFLNRHSFLDDAQRKASPADAYGRNEGVEFSYSNQSGTISAWTGHHFSQKPGVSGQNSFHQVGAMYSGRNLTVMVDLDQIGTNYYADMGFVNRIDNYTYVLDKKGKYLRDTSVRLGYKMMYNEITYTVRPKDSKTINTHEFYTSNWIVWNPNNSFNEYNNELSYTLMFKNTSEINVYHNYYDTRALFPFSFTDSDYPLPSGTYKYSQWGMRYSGDYRKAFTYSFRLQGGQFYNGTLRLYRFNINYRAQPWGNFGLSFERNDIELPERYGNDRLLLIGPRAEISFSNNLFWTTFLQYNTQRNNFNVNSRLQWRYKPMSDFFLVYTDNYFTDPLFKNKNRGLVFKLNYWLSL